MKLILFDIDGTLLRCGPQVAPAFLAAMTEVFGDRPELSGYSFSGKTDGRIVIDLMARCGWSEGRVRSRLLDVRDLFALRLEACLQRDRMTLLPGVQDLLDHLTRVQGERNDLRVGLLTGNWRASALVKLSRFGLERYFPFGAFAEDGVEREDLVPAALGRAQEHSGLTVRAAEVVIVGDTTLDVACARHHGCRSLAVATGRIDLDALRAARADWVVADLSAALEHPAFQ